MCHMKTTLKFRNIHGKTLASEFFNIEGIHLAYLLTETPAQLFWHKILQNFLEQFFKPREITYQIWLLQAKLTNDAEN